jgi:Protein of unknown function (DUF2478)
MSAMPSAQMPEIQPSRAPVLAALVYPEDKYPAEAFKALVASCRSRGMSLAGVLQHLTDAAPNRRCDVVLEDLASGHRTAIFEDRGANAAGCRLDEAALAEASARIEASLESAPDLLVLNKFGKAECGGGGLLDLVASAMDREISVIIGVPRSNLEVWRSFAGALGIELPAASSEIERFVESL